MLIADIQEACEVNVPCCIKRHVRFNAIIIPDNATNGDVIMAMFPAVEVKEKNNGYEVYFGVGTATQYFNHQWWNAPYKG